MDVYTNNFLKIQLHVLSIYLLISWMDDQLKNTFGATEQNAYYPSNSLRPSNICQSLRDVS